MVSVGFCCGFLFPHFLKRRACLRSSTWNKGEENSEKARFSTFGIPTMNLGDRPWIWGIDQGRISSPIPKQLFKNKGTRFRLLFSGNVLTSFLYNPYKLQPRISSPTSFLAAPELLGWNHFFGVKKSGVMFFKPTADRTWNNGYYLKKETESLTSNGGAIRRHKKNPALTKKKRFEDPPTAFQDCSWSGVENPSFRWTLSNYHCFQLLLCVET